VLTIHVFVFVLVQTPLLLAVLNGNAEITQILLSFGAQPSVKDSNGNTALHLAVLHGNLDCVKVILNTNNAKSLPLNDFNDEGKCIAGFFVLVVLQEDVTFFFTEYKSEGSAMIWIK
jgi:ankyrin repeat protein